MKLLVFQVFLLMISAVSSYYFTGYQIRDLEEDDECFVDDATSWSATRIISGQHIYSLCAGIYILGGYNVLGSMSSPYQAGDYFSRIYTGLSSTHTMVYFAFSFWQIDSWNGSPDYFQVAVDGTVITGWNTYNYGSMTAAQKVQVCGTTGDSYPDVVDTRTFGRVAHTGTSLTFKMISQCDQDSTNESLGFRELTILVVENPTTTGATQAICGLATLISLGTTWQCTCAEGKYLDSTSTCIACDSSCSSCFGIGSNQCYECADNYGFDGINCVACSSHCTVCSGTGSDECYECESGYLLYYNQCVLSSDCVSPLYTVENDCDQSTCNSPCDEDEYIYNNGTCGDYCFSPLQTGAILDTLLCIYPCDSGEYLYWDGTCEDSCDSPLTIRTQAAEVYCDYSCASTGEYLYWDGSCSGECVSPLVIVSEHDRLFCTYPCDSDEYLYWDGTCEDTCPDPLTTRVEKGKNLCDYGCASPGEYLYWDGTCSDSCPSPLVSETPHDRLLCTYPCDTDEYLYEDSSCKDSCGIQYTLTVFKVRNFCDVTCSLYQLWNGTCVENCYSPMRLLTNVSGTFCSLPCDSISEYYYPERGTCSSTCSRTNYMANNTYLVCYEDNTTTTVLIEQVTLSKLLHHIRYIDVEFPEKLGNISIMRGTNFISLRVKSSMFQKVTNWPTRLSLPSVFEYYFLPSSFLANFGDDLILIGMILTAAMVSFILERVFALMGSSGLKTFFNRIRIMTQWNLPIMIIIQNSGDIIFFAMVEFKSLEMEDVKSLVSLGLCLVMLALILTNYLLGIVIVQKFQLRKKESAKSLTHFVSSWEKFQVLFRGYNDENIFSQLFFVVYSFRIMLPMVITYSFPTVPLFQTIAFTVITISMLLYLILKKPIQQQFDLINLIIIEFLILLSDACLLCLVIYDMKNRDKPKERKFFGDVIIVCDYCFDVLAVGALIIKSILIMRTAFKFRKSNSKRQERSAWLQLLFLPLQQGSLGFEQVQVDAFMTTNTVVPHVETPQLVTLNDHHHSTSVIYHNTQSIQDLKSSNVSTQIGESSPIKSSQDSHRTLISEAPEEPFLKRKKLIERLNIKEKTPGNLQNSSPRQSISSNIDRINAIRRVLTPHIQRSVYRNSLNENPDFTLNSSRNPRSFYADAREKINEGNSVIKLKKLS